MNKFLDKLPFMNRGGRSSTRTVRASGHVSRRSQEERQQRIFLLSVGLAGLLVILILVGGLTYEYFIKPNQVLAEVNGQQIKRRDYWKYQSVVLYQQARLYENYAAQSTGQQQSQFLGFAASLDAQRGKIWGSTGNVSSATIQNMIDNQLYIDGAAKMGIDLPESDVELTALNAFSPAGAPLMTPVPTPTMIPARAAAATQTAEAALATPVTGEGTPSAAGIPGAGTPAAATPVTGAASPVASPAGSPAASPIVNATAIASPGVAPGTPDPKSAADASFTNFENQVFDKAHMSRADYYRLFAKPQLAREKVDAILQNAVPQSARQAHLSHILVATQELAQQLYGQATGGASFEALARANSTDTLTSPTGGDLGWVTRDEINPASADAAFALKPGQVTEPIQTPYGWEIIRVNDVNPDRPLSETQYENARKKTVDTWVAQQREATKIKTDYTQTPTPTPDAFAPPAGAPTVPPATPVPTVPPPVLGPYFGTPAATPVMPIGPEATPGAGSTPVSTPALVTTPKA